MSTYNAYMALEGSGELDVCANERLSRHTTYRIGGPAELFVTCHSYAALCKTVRVLAEEGVDWVILGKGSNVLASDAGYKGAVIVLDGEFGRVSVDAGEGLVTAGAGALLSRVVNEAYRAGLSGLECCAGIPGTVGGAVSMDAGSRREWIGSRVRDVVVLRPGAGMHRYGGGEVEWGYRSTSIPTSEIVLEATFELEPRAKESIQFDMEQRITRRKSSQPVGKPCCGSVFRNPTDGSAGALVEAAGLKGCTCGRAQVAPEHANFVVNTGGATAADVVSLIGLMHDTVLEQSGVDLLCEVKLLGFGE